jgi:hypothetical protein
VFPDHHAEVWGKCHAPSRCYWRVGGVRNTCYKCFSHRRKRSEVLEVTTLEVTVPLALVLDGDATIFAFTTMVELGPEIGHSNAGHRHTWHRWRMWC